MSLNMSPAEREEFLAGLHVGVLAVTSAGGAGPLTVPVWYTYQPGGTVNLSTGRDTPKARAVAAAEASRPENGLSGGGRRRDHGAWPWCVRRR